MRDFLDRVKLSVIFFTNTLKMPKSCLKKHCRAYYSGGEFSDDGLAFDEVPGDGVFTVALPVAIQPGEISR